MESILEWGIGVILWLQQFSPALDLPFKILTFTGDELFYLLLLPVIIWCISLRTGVRLMALLLLNTYVNSFSKLLFDQPRPFHIDETIKKIVHATGGGFPSGHTQITVVFWSYLAASFKHKWLWILAALMMIFVPLSRVYLGVHFPTDLLGGYVLGIIILLLFMKFEQPVIDWLQSKTMKLKLLLSSVIPLFLLLILPSADATATAVCGVLMGGWTGLVLEQKLTGFQVATSLTKKLICYLVGTVILVVLYYGLRKAFQGLEPQPVFAFIRYTIIGFHFTFLAPWIFVKLKLA